MSLSNSPSARRACRENWVSTGLGAAVPRSGRGRGAEPLRCGSAVRGGHPESSGVSPCRTDAISRESRAALIASRRCPVRGIALSPGFWGRTCRGGRSRARAGCTTARTPRPAPSSASASARGGSECRGCPEFPRSQPGSGWGWLLFSCGGISCWGRPLVRRPLSLRGDYLLAAALFSAGHGACVGCGSCAGKPQSPWSDRGVGPPALPLLRGVNSSRPGSCAAAPPVPARGAGTGTAGSSHRVPWPLPGAAAVPPSRLGGDNAVGPVGPAVLRRGGCTL